VHFMRNLLTRVANSPQPFVATMVRAVVSQPWSEGGPRAARARLRAVDRELPQVVAMLSDGTPGVAAFAVFPAGHWAELAYRTGGSASNREFRRNRT
jgi:putative transposase